MKKKRKEFLSKLNEEERKIYKSLTKEQRNKVIYMNEDKARSYMYKNRPLTVNEIRSELSRISGDIEGSQLSKKATNEDLKEKEFKCKYCGQGFRTEESVDKHQRTCV